MSFDPPPPDLVIDPVIADRDHLRYTVGTPLTVISARAQLLERHLGRATGLADPERTLILTHLAAMRQEIQLLVTRIEVVIGPGSAVSGGPVPPVTIPGAKMPR